MSVRSHEAFLEQIRSGNRTTKTGEIYQYLKNREWFLPTRLYNLNSLKKHFDLTPHQTVTARLSELCDMGVIYEDENGYFHITPDDKIEQYAAMREDARYKKWKKLGEKNGWFIKHINEWQLKK